MTTLDLLERAHARLTELRDSSVEGPWSFTEQSPQMDGRNWTIRTEGEAGMKIAAHDYGHFRNVELITTLHRTIDAQLKILAHDIDIYKQVVALGQEAAADAAIRRAGDADLARAILNEQ